MPTDSQKLRQPIDNPRESLNVELKSWIDPSSDAGKEKIIRAVAAIRNQDGGYLIIGIDDGTHESAPEQPANPRLLFRDDDVQQLISSHLSEPFLVELEFVDRGGVDHPVISIPSGVRNPAVIKRPSAELPPTRSLFEPCFLTAQSVPQPPPMAIGHD